MSKIKKSLPLAIRVDVIVCLLMAVLQDDLSFAILASLFILLTSLCIWEMSKEDPDNLVKALLGSNKYLIFDCFGSVLMISLAVCGHHSMVVISGILWLFFAISSIYASDKLLSSE